MISGFFKDIIIIVVVVVVETCHAEHMEFRGQFFG